MARRNCFKIAGIPAVEDVQDEIQRTGRRSGYTGVSEKNKDVFRADWGLQPDRVLSPSKCQLPMFCLNA